MAVACGDQHSLLLCSSGEVYAAGSNAAGACGLPVVQLRAESFTAVPLPAGAAGAASAVSCGGRNTAAVTASGRLLVCGCNEFGQAATGGMGGARFLLADVGPSADWHGMQRSNQLPGGGWGDAAARVVGAACGSGSLYALTEPGGEVFSWGQGGQGERHRGLCNCGARPAMMVTEPSKHGAHIQPSQLLVPAHPPPSHCCVALQASWPWEATARMCAPPPSCRGPTAPPAWLPPAAAGGLEP